MPSDTIHEREHCRVVREPTRADRILDAALAEQFHRARQASARLRMLGRGRIPLRHDTVDPKAVEQHRHRQSNRPAADDENRGVVLYVIPLGHAREHSLNRRFCLEGQRDEVFANVEGRLPHRFATLPFVVLSNQNSRAV
jgi:hypothetical protein